MPNKHAAIKDLRKNRKHAAHNARIRTNVKALTKQLKSLVKEGKKAEAMAIATKLQQAAAKAAKSHVYHGNKSGRVVSSAHKLVNTLK